MLHKEQSRPGSLTTDPLASELQAIARIFRFGQEHPTHVYRIMAKNTFGHRVYRRSVDKESLFKRVIDKRHIKGAPPEVSHWGFGICQMLLHDQLE